MTKLLDPAPTGVILFEVYNERKDQNAKWGVQNHLLPIWMSILGEEYGEACTDANKAHWNSSAESKEKHRELLRAELIQVAAVAVAAIECIDRRGDL